ncbi:MAG: thioredoxin family protein [Candidatus Brocadiaceae bacterium]|nr:thioredoxin family protein [Candidatus Brocadiaceae bacterium]
MVLRIAVAVLVGGGVGLGVGLVGSRLGGQCPLACNPYISTAIGVVMGLLVASSGGGVMPASALVKMPRSDDEYSLVIGQDGVVVVEFHTRNCPACARQAPIIDSLAERLAGRATVATVDARRLRRAAHAEGIGTVPTTLIFRNGRRAERLVGLTDEETLARLVERHLSADDSAVETEGTDAQ